MKENSNYKVLIDNTGIDGYLGFIITLSSTTDDVQVFGPSDYIAPYDHKSYDNATYVNTLNIPTNIDLKANFTTYTGGPSGKISNVINFGENNTVHIMLKISSKGTVSSEIKMYNS